MADWYVSSAAYTAVAQFAISTAYTVGQIIRSLAAPAVGSEHCYRCTTAGTSAAVEPTWNNTNNATTTSGGAVFTCVTGQSTYGWSAPAGRLSALDGAVTTARFAAGDRVFLSSDHAQTENTASMILRGGASLTAPILYISVNRAGSVPPAAADYSAGASITNAGTSNASFIIETGGRWSGFTFSAASALHMANGTNGPLFLRDCSIVLASTSAGISNNGATKALYWQNVSIAFSAVTQTINLIAAASTPLTLDWAGGSVSGTAPTALFPGSGGGQTIATIRGVDLSLLGSGKALVNFTNSGTSPVSRYTFQNCKLGASVTAIANSQSLGVGPTVELINCDSANTNYRCERHCSPQGDVTTETTITLSGGASDGTTTFSRKMVSTATVSPSVLPLEGFPMDVWNTATGASKTATVEIISSGTLTTADISLQVEYLGDAASCRSSLADNYLATDLTAAANVTASSATWNSSPATPVKQKLQVTFTPQKVGPVRGIVALRKASATCYVDPVMAIA